MISSGNQDASKMLAMTTTELAALIAGIKKQRSHLLAFAARHELVLDF